MPRGFSPMRIRYAYHAALRSHVSAWHLADIVLAPSDVRLQGQSGRKVDMSLMSAFDPESNSDRAHIDAVLNMAFQEIRGAPPVEEPEEMPLPSDPKAIFLGGLFVVALLAVAYVASEIVLPLAFAIILNLLLQPALRMLERVHVPRILAALLLILMLFGTIVGLGTVISGPAGTWAAKLPEGIPRLQERLSFMRAPINTLQRFLHQVEDIGGTAPVANSPAAAQGPSLLTELFTGTRNFARGFFTTVLFLFFLLMSGDIFMRRLVEILPRFSSKRQVVEISLQIERDISAYLVTITILNTAVGVAMALTMWLTGVGDPIFWGTVAFLLNYVPILGTAVGVLIFLLAGLLTVDTLWQALLPMVIYLGIHFIEGETVTPLLLAKRFTLNPVLVVISLVFWFWMWGAPGAILSVPMLAITKIICDRIRPLAAFGHFLEG
jgi:predicted PurR-regulated permease PerM